MLDGGIPLIGFKGGISLGLGLQITLQYGWVLQNAK